MVCFTKDPAFLLDLRLGPDVNEKEIYQCYFKEDSLYFSNWTIQQTNVTSCLYQGTGVLFNGKIPKRAKSYGDREICRVRDSGFKKPDSTSGIKHVNESIHHCTLQRYYERGRFYTDPATAERIENADLAACLMNERGRFYTDPATAERIENADLAACLMNERGRFYTDPATAERIENADLAACLMNVSKTFVIFLFSAWCLRIIFYPLLLELFSRSKCRHVVFCVICCSYETATLVVSIILPFLYRSHTLIKTTMYYVMLTGNIVMFVITVLVCFLVACLGDRNEAKKKKKMMMKKKKRRVKEWKVPPLTPAVSHSMIPEIMLLELRPSSSTEELDQVKNLVLALWSSNRVGIGRDARGLNHKNIEIIGVRKMETPISQQYINRQKDIMNYVMSLPNEKVELDYKENSEPVLTIEQLVDNNSTIKDLVSDSINEVFLFHGTSTVNIASIEQKGFDVKKK